MSDLLKIALSCMDYVMDTDGSLQALKTEITNFLANKLNEELSQVDTIFPDKNRNLDLQLNRNYQVFYCWDCLGP